MMMQAQAPLMQRAQERAAPANGPAFQKPDLAKITPPEMRDAVDRIVAAGMKIMYSPSMRKELMNELQRDVPMPQKLAEGVVGLVLTLDKQTKGGLPMAAIFPAEMELLAEAAELAQSAGQTVTQQDFNDAAMGMAVLTAKKMGGNDQEIMGAAEQWVGGADDEQAEPVPDDEAAPGEPAAGEMATGPAPAAPQMMRRP